MKPVAGTSAPLIPDRAGNHEASGSRQPRGKAIRPGRGCFRTLSAMRVDWRWVGAGPNGGFNG